MSKLSRTIVLGACAAAIIGCGSGTEPSMPATVTMRIPSLTNYGGLLLSPLRLVVIAAANDSLRDSLFAFAKALPTSQWWPAVATPFGVSATATAFTVSGPPLAAGTQMTLPDVAAYIQGAAIDSAGLAPDGRTVYLMYLPSGVSCINAVSCTKYTGFHLMWDATDAVALVLRAQGGASSMMEAMTSLASHEIIESATDPADNTWKLVSPFLPWTGSPWGLDDGGTFEENADMCQGSRYLERGFYYQRIFSNQAAATGGDPCVPAISAPYFNVSTNGWYSTSTGDITIPLSGWSVGTAAEWVIGVRTGPQTASLPNPTFSLSCPDTVVAGKNRYCGMNTGKTATLHVVLPAGALSQSFFTFYAFSFRVDTNGQMVAGPNEDNYHKWIFGVYVP